MAEMTAVEYFKQKGRMVERDTIGGCSIACSNCPLERENNGRKINCSFFEKTYPEEAVAIVQKWAEEHPQKTMLQDFFEKFPEAQRKKSGEPVICPETLGYRPEGTGCHVECYDCWNRPLEE